MSPYRLLPPSLVGASVVGRKGREVDRYGVFGVSLAVSLSPSSLSLFQLPLICIKEKRIIVKNISFYKEGNERRALFFLSSSSLFLISFGFSVFILYSIFFFLFIFCFSRGLCFRCLAYSLFPFFFRTFLRLHSAEVNVPISMPPRGSWRPAHSALQPFLLR